ncbi:MAG TPA: sugar transferase [Candidatus Saccharimonadales bacterium]|nr:sugar transferase [Candidatus Saccharimonadales bacterium]
MKNNASLTYNACLIVGDFLALVAAFVAAYILRVTISHETIANPVDSHSYLLAFLALLPFWILIFALLGLYNSNIYERRFSEVGRLLIGSFIGMLFIIFWSFLSVKPIFPAKLVPIYGFGLGFVFLVLFRNIARFVRTSLFSYNIGLTKVVLVGNTSMTRELLDSLANSRHSGYKVLAVIGGKRQVGEHAVLTYANFREFLQSTPADLHGIIQTELYADESRNAEILTYAQEHHINYRFVPGNSELFVGNIDVELFRSSVPVINVHHTALFGWGRIVKRLTDILFGGILLILSSPLWLLIAIAIKASDPGGPVFYRAKRLTRFGNTIRILKFRTMKQAYNGLTPEEGFAKMGKPELGKQYRANGDQLENDPRVSTVGRFLRATSFDELPQLFNVVHGEISLVGPRALDVFELEQFSKKNLILSVKSGLTGLALVSGRPGISFEERRKLDLYYVQNWSFWLDVVVLAKTVRVVFERLMRRGARY